jgi:hypothetical protein
VPNAISALSVLLLASSLTHASIEYRAKNDQAGVYRAEALEPPPLAVLSKGDAVTLMVRGVDRSLVRTEGGIKGWVRNVDLEGVRAAEGSRHALKPMEITGDAPVFGCIIFIDRDPDLSALPIDRSFTDEIIETADREQTEMRHDEN